MTALDQVKAYAKAKRAAGRPLHFDVAFAVSRPTLKQIRDWYEDCPARTKAEAIEWLAHRALATTGEVELQRALAENRDARLVLAALVESLGGEITIPASALVDAPRTITVERGLDRSIILRTGEA